MMYQPVIAKNIYCFRIEKFSSIMTIDCCLTCDSLAEESGNQEKNARVTPALFWHKLEFGDEFSLFCVKSEIHLQDASKSSVAQKAPPAITRNLQEIYLLPSCGIMATQERRNNWQEIESKKVSVLHLHLRKYNKCQSWCSPSQSILSLPLLLQPTKFYQMIKVEEFRLCCLPPPFPARDWVSPRLHLLFDLWQPLQSSSDHCRYRRRLMLTRRYPTVFLKYFLCHQKFLKFSYNPEFS